MFVASPVLDVILKVTVVLAVAAIAGNAPKTRTTAKAAMRFMFPSSTWMPMISRWSSQPAGEMMHQGSR